MDEILDTFEIEYNKRGPRLTCACFIHGGDNPEALSILRRGVGSWNCYTQQCHTKYRGSTLSLIQQLLSINKRDPVSFSEAIHWSAKLVNEEQIDSESYSLKSEQNAFVKLTKNIIQQNREIIGVEREKVTSRLIIPAPYYLHRGYTPEVLKRYDVGHCIDPKKEMYDRAVVPLYDASGNMVGCIGRSIYEKCERCSGHHSPFKPCSKKVRKWMFNSAFDASGYIYNYYSALPHIQRTNTIILVEGTGDVWRLEESGIPISVALLGTKFTDEQKILIEKSGATNLIVISDQDDAGKSFYLKINNECNRLYNVYHILPTCKDVGDMNSKDIKKVILPQVIEIVGERLWNKRY